ncbi:phage antirepressor KilAC domain-containing protein [Morganella psychrotolerans]|uniref:phage antirepressor KilAC domain-containing protein n=1 Tax=Morganella psychrotolerans TaxID=368603 RepID=UPI000945CC09|nr:phage antirepressor KilAC domain-containing protein [Morganella psychrotolerans]
MSNLIIVDGINVRRDIAGRYCLNDLHRAAGGEERHKPSNFLRIESIQALCSEIDRCSDMSIASANTIRGGFEQGTYVVREIVYAYAMWVSPLFNLKVIRTFDSLPAQQHAVPQSLSEALRLAADLNEELEEKARALAIAAPKAEFVDRYVETTGSMTFRQVCKLLKVKEPEFRMFLLDQKIMYRLNGSWAVYQNHIDAGRFDIKTGTSATSNHSFSMARFTSKGVKWVAGLWGTSQVEGAVA